jgi:hypothetical protein
MMGDTSVATVNKHYFNIELDLMQEMVLGWERPAVPVPSSASLTLWFRADADPRRTAGPRQLTRPRRIAARISTP